MSTRGDKSNLDALAATPRESVGAEAVPDADNQITQVKFDARCRALLTIRTETAFDRFHDLRSECLSLSPDLRRLNLAKARLRRANLSGADLRRANLSGADLTIADLEGADLRGTILRGTILNGADMRGADMRGTILDGVDLTKVKGLEADQIARAAWYGVKLATKALLDEVSKISTGSVKVNEGPK